MIYSYSSRPIKQLTVQPETIDNLPFFLTMTSIETKRIFVINKTNDNANFGVVDFRLTALTGIKSRRSMFLPPSV